MAAPRHRTMPPGAWKLRARPGLGKVLRVPGRTDTLQKVVDPGRIAERYCFGKVKEVRGVSRGTGSSHEPHPGRGSREADFRLRPGVGRSSFEACQGVE